MSLKDFKNIASNEYIQYRNSFRENYSWIESYCARKHGKGNYLDWLSSEFNFVEENKDELKNLVSLDFIRSNSFNFEINPTVQQAIELLRKTLIDDSINSSYTKSIDRAVLEILQQIRDNITHHGKYEIESDQYNRNVIIIKNASIISERIVDLIDNN